MANYSAADVKKLRELTGAGFMDCKKALEENEGDFDKAIEFLRIKNAKNASKRAERTTAEGMVAASGNALVELNSETDFVAKNAEFQGLATKVTAAAAQLPAGTTVAELLASSLGNGTVQDTINDVAGRLGEKLVLNRVAKFDGQTSVYLHKRSADLPAVIGVLVQYIGDDSEAARGTAMQISAVPTTKYLSRDEVPGEVLESEKRVAEGIAREEGKPEAALPKIVEGRVSGFYKAAVLGEQASVRDSKKTVAKVLEEVGVEITAFVRFEVGTA